jgi:VanZ family protein
MTTLRAFLNHPITWAVLTALWMFGIYALSDRPAEDFDSDSVSWLPFADKFVHVALYAVLSVFSLRTFISVKAMAKHYAVFSTVLLAVVWGVLDEVHQSEVTGRSSEISDVVADGFGAVLVVVIWFVFNRYRTFYR